MSVLTMIQHASEDVGLAEPSSIENSTNRLVLQMLRLLSRASYQMRSLYQWSELDRESAITLVAATSGYALPADYFGRRPGTEWNRNAVLQLYGPYTASEWEAVQHGNLSATSQFAFKVSGMTDTQIDIYPVPVAADAGTILSYIYQSTQWILPRKWVASETWTFSARTSVYCSYNGNVYLYSAGGSITTLTCGTVPPTHTTGSVSDGSISWTYQSAPYLPAAYLDYDWSVLDETLVETGIAWMYARLKGKEYADEKREWLAELRRAHARQAGAQTLSLSRRSQNSWRNNIPDRGYA